MKKWYAVYTKFKCEKKVLSYLQTKGVTAYVPLIGRTKRYTRKIKHYQIPLISCYVFVCIEDSERVSVLETPFVFQFVKIKGHSGVIPESEINILKRITGELNELELLQESTAKVGQPVELIAGNLCGLQGRIVEIKGKKEFLIELEHIGISLRIQVDASQLRPLNRKVA